VLLVALLPGALACKAIKGRSDERQSSKIEAKASHAPKELEHGAVLLSSPGSDIHGFTQDSSYLYFIKGYRAETRLLSVPKAGGKTQVMALIGDNVDFILPGDNGVIVGGWSGIHRVATSASLPERLYPQRVFGLAGEGSNLYFSTRDTIYRMPRAGGSPRPLVSGQQNYIVSMGVADGFVYWANNQEKALMRVPVDAGRVEILCSGVFPGSRHAILFDKDFAYYFQAIPHSFRRMPKKGGTPEVLASPTGHSQGWALVDDGLYYGRGWSIVGGGIKKSAKGRRYQQMGTSQGKGGLIRVSLASRNEVELANLPNGQVEGVAVDAKYVYWLDAAAGRICKVSR